MAVSSHEWVIHNGNIHFLVLLNFLTFIKNTLYAFHQKCATTAIAEISSWKWQSSLVTCRIFLFSSRLDGIPTSVLYLLAIVKSVNARLLMEQFVSSYSDILIGYSLFFFYEEEAIPCTYVGSATGSSICYGSNTAS